MISITEADVFASRKKASMRLLSTKCMVRRHFPPTRPITLSTVSYTHLDVYKRQILREKMLEAKSLAELNEFADAYVVCSDVLEENNRCV